MTPMSDDQSMPWWQEFIAFDTETTGVDPATDRIVTAAVVRFAGGQPVDEREWLVKVDVPIPVGSTEVHGITDEHAQTNGIDPRQALGEMHEYLTSSALPIVAFNAPFDIAMLNANLIRYGLSVIDGIPIMCPYVIDKHLDKYVKGRNQRRLMPTIQRYGLQLDEDSWHGATADARITGELFLAQMDKFPDLRGYSPSDLSSDIAIWRDQQEADFQQWLAAKRAEES